MKRIRWLALDKRVIVVAVEGSIHDWTAYIGAVPGHNHAEEWEQVLQEGNKLSKKVAEVLFPDFADLSWRE